MARAAKPDDGFLQISGKDLGAFAMPDACPRCLWVRLHAKPLPYQVFPGIFSSIDSYSKKMVHGWFDRTGEPPPWLAQFERFAGYRDPPGSFKFRCDDADARVRLTGAPDAVFERADGTLCIADYKTARHTAGQDALLPIYETQLNAYRTIAERLGWPPVTRLLLLYLEPATEDDHARDATQDAQGFQMGFHAKAHDLRLDVGLVPRLMREARATWDAPEAPASRDACKECAAVERLAMRVARETA